MIIRLDIGLYPFKVSLMNRILITTYQKAFLFRGGGEMEIFILCNELNRAGHIAQIYGPSSKPISYYDTVIHFSLTPECKNFVQSVRSNSSKLILWPNLWFVNKPEPNLLAELQSVLDLFDVIVFKSEAERKHFASYLDVKNLDVLVVRTGISNKFENAVKTNHFNEIYKVDEYVFWPGIIEPQKNQLALIKAANDLDMDVFFSGSIRDKEYFAECTKIASSNIHFLNEMEFLSEVHISAILNCSLFVELPFDFPGISAVEAKFLGCQVLLTDCDWSRENFGKDAFYANPRDKNNIRNMLSFALNKNNQVKHKKYYGQHLSQNSYNQLISYL